MSLIIKLTNFNQGRKIITSIVKSYPMNTKFTNELLEELLTHHPSKKISNIEYLMIKPHPIYRSRCLFFKTKTGYEDNVSYKLCIQNLFGQYSDEKNNKQNKISSFRNAISNTKRLEFKNNLTSMECQDCNIVHDKPHIDHYKFSFKSIMDQFLFQDDIKIEDVKTIYHNNQHHLLQEQKEAFIDYHDSVVIYKLLCPECNISNGTYGYLSN